MKLFTPPNILDGHRWRGLRVGLLGGSFNPPHDGHLHISDVAIKALNLDCVWWLVTPQNPLKSQNQTLPFEQRMALCETLTRDHKRILISDLENQFGTVRTIQTIQNLNTMFPFTELVLLAGTDIVPQLPRWYRWQDIPRQIAMAFISRPPATALIRQNAVNLMAEQNHHLVSGATKSPLNPGNCFWIRGHKLHPASSTKIRNT